MILISEYEKPSGVDQKTVEAYYVVSSEADILVSVPINTTVRMVYLNGVLLGDGDYQVEGGAVRILKPLSKNDFLAIKYDTGYSINLNAFNALKQYCLRRLGAPTIKVNVTDEQLNDCLMDAMQRFVTWHYAGSERFYMMIPMTKTVRENGYVTLPEDILGVRYCIRMGSEAAVPLLSSQYMVTTDLLWSMVGTAGSLTGFTGLQYYYITRDYLNMMETVMYPEQDFRFNPYTHRLTIIPTTTDNTYGNNGDDLDAVKIFETYLHGDTISDEVLDAINSRYVIAECYRAVNFDEFPDAYNDIWLKKYCTELIKKQWGQNLKKFDGVELVGGVTVNGGAMYDEAVAEIEKLEEELHKNWQLPPLPEIG